MPAVVNNTTNINVANTTDIKSRGWGAGDATVNNKTDIDASSKYGDVSVGVKNDRRMDLQDEGRRFPGRGHHGHCPPFLKYARGEKPWA